MARSKALIRIRGEREEANLRLSEKRAVWNDVRRDVAHALDRDWLAGQEVRASERYVALERLRDQLDQFATEQAHCRIAQDNERAACMLALVGAVNEMIAAFGEARTARREDALALSKQVSDFLDLCRSERRESNAEHIAQSIVYRAKLSDDAFRACTNDFPPHG